MRNICIFLGSLILLSSCVPQRRAVYVQSIKGQPAYNNNWSGNKKNVQIEVFDLLYIKINTIDQPEYNFFNQETQNTFASEAGISIIAYMVDELGFVNLPVIGKIKLKDLTLEEAAHAIKDALKDVLNTPIVSVRFVNNSVTVLGEVLKAGTYSYPTEQINIFRAIGLAGDITEYGNKRSVILIRENGKEIHKHYLDLTKDDIFRSEYYYLRPNDIVYVPPLKIRRFGMKEIPFALILSFVNTLFVTLVYAKLLK